MSKFLRKMLAIIICLGILLSAVPANMVFAEGTQAIIVNPGFEEPLNSDGTIPGWDRIYGDETDFSVTDTAYYSGSYSLKVDDKDSGAGKWMYSSKISVNPGDKLTASAWVKVDKGAAEFCLKFFDNDGADVGNYSDTTVFTGDWSLQSVQGTVPDGATKACIFIYSGMSAVTTAYFDDVSLTIIPLVPPVQQDLVPDVLINYDCFNLMSLVDQGWNVGTPVTGAYVVDSTTSLGNPDNVSIMPVAEGQILFYMDDQAGEGAVDAFKLVDVDNKIETKPWKLELDLKLNDIMKSSVGNVLSGFSILVNTGERVNRINFGGDNKIRIETQWDDPYPQCVSQDVDLHIGDGIFHKWSIAGDGKGLITITCDNNKVAEFSNIAFLTDWEPGIQFINYYNGIESGKNEIYFDNIKLTVYKDKTALINTGFENDINADGTIPGWTQWYGNTGFTVTGEDKYSGIKSLLVNDQDTGTSFWLLSNMIPVNSGEKYEIAGKVKVVSGSVQVNVAYLDDNNNLVKYYENDIICTDTSNLQWITTKTSGIAPAGVTKVAIFIYSGLGATGVAYVDDLSLSKVDDTGLRNLGFEEEIYIPGTIPGWFIKYGDSNNFSVTGDIKHSGNFSLKVADADTQGSKWLYSNKIPVSPGNKCKATGWIYFEDGNEVNLCIRYFDADGNEIAAYPATGISSPKGEWVEKSVEGIVPEGAVQASVFIYSGYGAVCRAYFDDMTLSTEQGTGIMTGSPVDLGQVVKAPLTVGSYIAKTLSGENELYFALNGTPSKFYVVNADTGEVKFSQLIQGMTHLYGIVQGSDSNIYFCGIDDGILYRYLPEQKKIENMGVNPSNKWVWDLAASRDGKIYGATYPASKVFEYDIASKTFRDLGSIVEGQDYARGIEVTDDYLYVGIGTTNALIRIDRETGEKTEIATPYSGQTRMTADIWAYNGKLFVRDETSTLFVLDEATGNWENTLTFRARISPPSPYDSNLIYYYNKFENSLYNYNMMTKEVQKITGIPTLPVSEPMTFQWITPNSGEKAGKPLLAIMMQFTEYMLYDPQDNWFKFVPINADPQGLEIQSIEKGPDGKLYIGGYQKATSIYNINTGKVEHNTYMFPQAEGIGFLNGKTYYGTYGGAVIYMYDPHKPFEPGSNPGVVYDIDEEQDRPFVLTSGDDKLFIGTISEYGVQGGALTVYDSNTGSWSVHRDVVTDQSIIGLAYKDGKLYGGTSIWGGLGIQPSQSEAKMFIWDVENAQKIDEFTVSIPGIDETPKMIGGLSFGPDGLLWGVVAGSVFAMNPETKEIVKSKVIFPSDYINNSTWRPYYLRWGNDGLLYTTVGRNMVVLNPETMAYDVLKTGVSLAALGDDGNIYYASGSNLFKLPLTRNIPYPSTQKEAALLAAVNEIAALPDIYDITLDDKEAVLAARELVDVAISFGAVNEEIFNLQELVECERKIAALESGKKYKYKKPKKVKENSI